MARVFRSIIGLGVAVAALFALPRLVLGAWDADGPVSWRLAVDEGTRAAPVWAQCWLERTGLAYDQVAHASRTLSDGQLVDQVSWRLPDRVVRSGVLGPAGGTTPAGVLASLGVPAWRVKPSAHPTAGRPVRVVHGMDACLPYPIKAVSVTSLPMRRGWTAAAKLDLATQAFCRAYFAEQASPCYPDGDNAFVVLVGLSALMEPGTYPLRLELAAGTASVMLSIPVTVGEGRYGFQYISPPPSLGGLMDSELMASELRALDPWREVRSRQRRWTLPLDPPLSGAASVSADYGDRRSYGGMVSGYHSGVDYRAAIGRRVLAPADGVVIFAESLQVRGNAMLIDHGWGLVTGYWHLSRFHADVGDAVGRGQVVAEVGNTGLSTGPHLHWEVWVNGVSVDGKQFLAEGGLDGVVLAAPAAVDEFQDPR